MKITLGSRILKIILKVLIFWTIVAPLLAFYEPYLKWIHLDYFVLWQRLVYFAVYVVMSVWMAYIFSLCIKLVTLYQQGEFFVFSSNVLVKKVITISKLYFFIALIVGLIFQYIIPQPIVIGGITAPQFGLISIISSVVSYLIQYAVLTGLGSLHTRECRAREEANLTV